MLTYLLLLLLSHLSKHSEEKLLSKLSQLHCAAGRYLMKKYVALQNIIFSSGRARDDVSSSDSDFALSSERTSKFRRSLNVNYSRRAYEERLRYLSRDWCKTERALDCPSPCSKRQTAAKLKSTSSEAENENYPLTLVVYTLCYETKASPAEETRA